VDDNTTFEIRNPKGVFQKISGDKNLALNISKSVDAQEGPFFFVMRAGGREHIDSSVSVAVQAGVHAKDCQLRAKSESAEMKFYYCDNRAVSGFPGPAFVILFSSVFLCVVLAAVVWVGMDYVQKRLRPAPAKTPDGLELAESL
jgi:hypothetical protein